MSLVPPSPSSTRALRRGTLWAFGAYGMWGLFPLYWKQLGAVDALQILGHRVVWSALFLAGVLALQGRLRDVGRLLAKRRSLGAVVGCALLITLNWGVYIWAVNAGRVTESALGYYITPLFSVALGALFFHEHLDRWTAGALGLATLGVAGASVLLGTLPWVSLALAGSFSIYGALKKRAGLDALSGLAAETLVAAPLALAWLMWTHLQGRGAFLGGTPKVTTLLLVAGPVTALPLLAFAFAATRIPLQRLGFIQYLSPTLQLALGLFLYGETLSRPMALAFGTVVVAVLLYVFSRGRSPRG